MAYFITILTLRCQASKWTSTFPNQFNVQSYQPGPSTPIDKTLALSDYHRGAKEYITHPLEFPGYIRDWPLCSWPGISTLYLHSLRWLLYCSVNSVAFFGFLPITKNDAPYRDGRDNHRARFIFSPGLFFILVFSFLLIYSGLCLSVGWGLGLCFWGWSFQLIGFGACGARIFK